MKKIYLIPQTHVMTMVIPQQILALSGVDMKDGEIGSETNVLSKEDNDWSIWGD